MYSAGYQELVRQLKIRNQKFIAGKKQHAKVEELRKLLLKVRNGEEESGQKHGGSSSSEDHASETNIVDPCPNTINIDDDNENLRADSSQESKSDIDDDSHADVNDASSYHDPKIHIALSTYNPGDETKHALHSKTSSSERRNQKATDRISKKNRECDEDVHHHIDKLKMFGLLCCDAQESNTFSCCIAGPFISKDHLEKHKQIGIHRYPSMNMVTHATVNAVNGKYAFCLALGSMTNRDRALSPDFEIQKSEKDFPTHKLVKKDCLETGCYRRDCTAWKGQNFRASSELIKDIRALFDEGEDRSSAGKKRNAAKYKPAEAASVLQNMMERNRRKYRTDGPWGRLPDHSVEYIQRKFAEWARKGAKGLISIGKESTNFLNDKSFEDLKKLYLERFGEELATHPAILISILKIDDDMKQEEEGDGNQYHHLAVTSLIAECVRRNLPSDYSKETLLALHDAYTQKQIIEARRKTETFQSALLLSEASATHYNILHGNKIK